jgi:hypothetical protein
MTHTRYTAKEDWFQSAVSHAYHRKCCIHSAVWAASKDAEVVLLLGCPTPDYYLVSCSWRASATDVTWSQIYTNWKQRLELKPSTVSWFSDVMYGLSSWLVASLGKELQPLFILNFECHYHQIQWNIIHMNCYYSWLCNLWATADCSWWIHATFTIWVFWRSVAIHSEF